MGNVLAIVIGLVCAILGIVTLALWWAPFIYVLKGCLGITLFCGGALALAIGISEMRAAKEFESAVPPATSTQEEQSDESSESEAPAETESTEGTNEDEAETKEEDSSSDS